MKITCDPYHWNAALLMAEATRRQTPKPKAREQAARVALLIRGRDGDTVEFTAEDAKWVREQLPIIERVISRHDKAAARERKRMEENLAKGVIE